MSEPFDRAELLDRVDNDVEFLIETVEMLEEESPGLLNEIDTAIKADDAPGLTHAAHTLKGMLGNFCAPPAQEAARKLEVMGREASLGDAGPAREQMESRLAELQTALRAFIAEQS
ncbi:MAG: Hpt domain-containing protein [Planctomycetota bacterium]